MKDKVSFHLSKISMYSLFCLKKKEERTRKAGYT